MPRPGRPPPPDNDRRKAVEKNSAFYLAREGSFSRTSSRDAAQKAQAGDNEKTPANTGESQHSQGLSPLRPTGLEPVTCGLGNRRSILLSYGRNLFLLKLLRENPPLDS